MAPNKTEFVAPVDENVVIFITRVVLKFGNAVICYQISTKDDLHVEVVTTAVLMKLKTN